MPRKQMEFYSGSPTDRTRKLRFTCEAIDAEFFGKAFPKMKRSVSFLQDMKVFVDRAKDGDLGDFHIVVGDKTIDKDAIIRGVERHLADYDVYLKSAIYTIRDEMDELSKDWAANFNDLYYITGRGEEVIKEMKELKKKISAIQSGYPEYDYVSLIAPIYATDLVKLSRARALAQY